MSKPVEALEPRRLMAVASPAAVEVQSPGGPPPLVTEVYISGSEWTQPYRDYLGRNRHGPGREDGFRVWSGQTSYFTAGWSNLDQITVHFYQPAVVELDDLRVRGSAGGDYAVASVHHRPDPFSGGAYTFTLAGRGLSRPDNLLVELDGGPEGVRSPYGDLLDGDRDGTPGGDFRLQFFVLPGATREGGSVSNFDLFNIRRSLGTSTTDRGRPGASYLPFADFNGDARIDARDYAIVRSRLYTYLPPSQPAAAAAQSSPALRSAARPATRFLFSDAAILR